MDNKYTAKDSRNMTKTVRKGEIDSFDKSRKGKEIPEEEK